MTVATERRTQALVRIDQYAQRQISAGRTPDWYVSCVDGTELACWEGGGFSYDNRPVYVSERGHLIVWSRHRVIRVQDGILFSRVAVWALWDWTLSVEEEGGDIVDAEPNLRETFVETIDLTMIGDYLASL